MFKSCNQGRKLRLRIPVCVCLSVALYAFFGLGPVAAQRSQRDESPREGSMEGCPKTVWRSWRPFLSGSVIRHCFISFKHVRFQFVDTSDRFWESRLKNRTMCEPLCIFFQLKMYHIIPELNKYATLYSFFLLLNNPYHVKLMHSSPTVRWQNSKLHTTYPITA